ncbi:sensor histidine kinase [Actinoplanes xinjiangensis]|uniref:Anti-sigma regulatory factor (Ser/Thr protein kinase) n=1 Tax=Actinoplanes xinjiangensis TaxID=512350 RepID=A0A316FMP2_9ACTN|nr:sensor histidine kinase [Actinoplanes xinjiangensis]PWK48936.1 anti-sigma regulatory factor (Ser/Thr protein kinase) [Actinoplanes xinjiangensis]GIF38642.1 anti-sigma regulatory factor [Actinoplanes xinjiangensis]
MTLTAAAVDAAVLDHSGLLYHDQHEYLHFTTAFVRSALATGDAVLVAVPGPNLALLRDALADVSAQVRFTDMAVAGRNPGRIIPGLLLSFSTEHAARRITVVSESVWPGRCPVEYPACAMHEALINPVFRMRNAAMLCPYDAANLDSGRLHDAWRTHPAVTERGDRRPSPRYGDPFLTAAAVNLPLPPVPSTAAGLSYAGMSSLTRVRRFVTAHATAGGLGDVAIDDLVIAVNELVDNTIEHTDGGGRVSIWTEPGRLICQVSDSGVLTDPLAGRIPPPGDAEGGRGLLLAHQLCDLVRIHTAAEGTSVRLHANLP